MLRIAGLCGESQQALLQGRLSARYGEKRLLITALPQKIKNDIRTECQKIDAVEELCISHKHMGTIQKCGSENAGKSFKKLRMLLDGSLAVAQPPKIT